MKKLLQFILPIFLVLFYQVNAQSPGCTSHTSGQSAKTSNGNGFLGLNYSNAYPGLNYAQASQTLTQRYTNNPGPVLPAAVDIQGLPCGGDPAFILQAYLYYIVEGNNLWNQVQLENPMGNSAIFTADMIGDYSGGKCWGCSGTYHYRADVTSIIEGNGSYTISGVPQSSFGCQDTDGATLIIFYTDPNATYRGEIYLYDGNITQDVSIAYASQTFTGFNVCDNSVAGTAFSAFGDMQDNLLAYYNVWDAYLNSTYYSIFPLFYNYCENSCSYTAGQNSAFFDAYGGYDCFSWIFSGVYYQTSTCTTFTPATCVVLDVTPFEIAFASKNDKRFSLNWNPIEGHSILKYEIEVNEDHRGFGKISEVNAARMENLSFSGTYNPVYYTEIRVKAYDSDGNSYYSNTLKIGKNAEGFVVYPSLLHSGDKLTFGWESTENQPYFIHLFDIQGKEVLVLKGEASKGSNEIQSDIVLAPGMYDARIISGVNSLSSRIVVH